LFVSIFLDVDLGSVGELTWVKVEEFGNILEDLVGVTIWDPRSDSENVQVERGGGGRVDRHSHDEGSSVVGEISDGKVIVVNVGRGPLVGSGPGGDWNIFSAGGIEEFEQPSSGSSDSGVHLDGVSSDNVDVLLVGGSSNIEHSDVGVVGWVDDGIQGKVRVRVSLVSLLVSVSQSSEASSRQNGVSGDGVDFVWNSSVAWGQQRIDLSTDVSRGGGNEIVGLSIVNSGVEVLSWGDSAKVGILEDSSKVCGGQDWGSG